METYFWMSTFPRTSFPHCTPGREVTPSVLPRMPADLLPVALRG